MEGEGQFTPGVTLEKALVSRFHAWKAGGSQPQPYWTSTQLAGKLSFHAMCRCGHWNIPHPPPQISVSFEPYPGCTSLPIQSRDTEVGRVRHVQPAAYRCVYMCSCMKWRIAYLKLSDFFFAIHFCNLITLFSSVSFVDDNTVSQCRKAGHAFCPCIQWALLSGKSL